MIHNSESSSPSTFLSIMKETFYQYMRSLLLCYHLMECLPWVMIIILPLADSARRRMSFFTQFPPLHLWFSQVIKQSRISANTENADTNHREIYHEIFAMGEFQSDGWIQENDRVIMEFCLHPLKFNDTIWPSEPLPNEDHPADNKRVWKYASHVKQKDQEDTMSVFQSLSGNKPRPSSCSFDMRSLIPRNDAMVNRVQDV